MRLKCTVNDEIRGDPGGATRAGSGEGHRSRDDSRRRQGQEIPLGVSYGVYAFSGGENAGDALDAADRAMYQAKRARKASRAAG